MMKGMSGNDLLRARDLTSDTLINCDGTLNPGSADLDKLPKERNPGPVASHIPSLCGRVRTL
jgi:hypothetical protein